MGRQYRQLQRGHNSERNQRELALLPLAEPPALPVLFARSAVEGLVLLIFAVGMAMLVAGVARRLWPPRYPRR